MPPERVDPFAAPLTGRLRSPAAGIDLPSGTPLPRVPAEDHGGDPVLMILAALRELPALLPWIYPPRAALPFSQPLVNTPINVAATTLTTLFTYIVPHGSMGRITAFGVAGSDFTNLQWTIRVRGNPAPPVTGIRFQWGTIAAPTLLPGPGLLLNSEDNVDVQVENIGAVGIADVQARIDGYLWRMEGR